MTTECPRCDSTLTQLTFAGAEAVACESCGYVGVEADHTGNPRPVESWDDALARFESRFQTEQSTADADAGDTERVEESTEDTTNTEAEESTAEDETAEPAAAAEERSSEPNDTPTTEEMDPESQDE